MKIGFFFEICQNFKQRMKQIVFLLATLAFFSCSQKSPEEIETTDSKKGNQISDSISADSSNIELEFDSGLQTRFSSYSAKKCFTENPDEFQLSENGEFCAERKVKLLIASTSDLKTGEAINKELFKRVTGEKAGTSSMQAWVNKVKAISDLTEATVEESECRIVGQSNRILSIGIYSVFIAYGAAHGMSGIDYVNFNLENGKVIQLNDVLSSGYEKELKKLGEKLFISENGREGWDFTPGKGDFFLSSNYAFTKKGILFSYGQYEIGSYGMGMPQMTIPYELIKSFIVDDSSLKSFMQAEN